jgi:hypothetical protein
MLSFENATKADALTASLMLASKLSAFDEASDREIKNLFI